MASSLPTKKWWNLSPPCIKHHQKNPTLNSSSSVCRMSVETTPLTWKKEVRAVTPQKWPPGRLRNTFQAFGLVPDERKKRSRCPKILAVGCGTWVNKQCWQWHSEDLLRSSFAIATKKCRFFWFFASLAASSLGTLFVHVLPWSKHRVPALTSFWEWGRGTCLANSCREWFIDAYDMPSAWARA